MNGKLTPMEQFAVDKLKDYEGEMSPNHLAYLWAEKNGMARASSRDMFGYTSAAYKTLRRLAVRGIINRIDGKTASGWSYENYSKKVNNQQ